jgi:hypothetical protein
MKKIIILSVLTLISMSTLRGQSKAEPSPAVAAEFSKQFKGATDVNWDKIGTLSFAQFQLQKHLTIAYFDNDGNLIAQGRKISEEQLPMRLRADLLAVKSEREKNSGVLSIGNIFEYTGESDYTQYVTSLENDRESIVVGTVNGKMTVRSKSKKGPHDTGTPKDLIAGLPK